MVKFAIERSLVLVSTLLRLMRCGNGVASRHAYSRPSKALALAKNSFSVVGFSSKIWKNRVSQPRNSSHRMQDDVGLPRDSRQEWLFHSIRIRS